MSKVARAVESGATTIRGIIDATGLSRLKVERALHSLEKQKLLIRDSQGFRAPGMPTTPPVRQCGSCSACCTLLEVTESENRRMSGASIASRQGMHHLRHRPQMCRSFSCAWLQGHLNDEWFPEQARMVVHFSQDAVNVQVDPGCPDRWRQEPYFSKLCEWSLNGIRMNGNRGYATLVVVGSDKFLLLGRTIVPDPTLFGTAFLPVTPETFRYWKARSQEHLHRLNDRIAEIQRIREEFGTAPSRTTTTLTRLIGRPFSDCRKSTCRASVARPRSSRSAATLSVFTSPILSRSVCHRRSRRRSACRVRAAPCPVHD